MKEINKTMIKRLISSVLCVALMLLLCLPIGSTLCTDVEETDTLADVEAVPVDGDEAEERVTSEETAAEAEASVEEKVPDEETTVETEASVEEEVPDEETTVETEASVEEAESYEESMSDKTVEYALVGASEITDTVEDSDFETDSFTAPVLFAKSPESETVYSDNGISSEFGQIILSGVKHWTGDTEADRPEAVTIQLYADGVLLKETEATAAGEWKYEFDISDQPIYNAVGNQIEYTVKELPIANYTEVVSAHVDPTVSFNFPSSSDGWTSVTTCANLKIDIVNDGSNQTVIAAKIKGGNGYVIWTPQALTENERNAVIANFPKGENTGKNIYFISGNGSLASANIPGLEGIDMTATVDYVIFPDKDNWAYIFYGTYTKASHETMASSITNAYALSEISITKNLDSYNTKMGDDATFIFKVENNDTHKVYYRMIRFSGAGTDSVTISGIPYGSYTVTELGVTGYEAVGDCEKTVEVYSAYAEVSFTNMASDSPLGDSASVKNVLQYVEGQGWIAVPGSSYDPT